MASTAPTLDEVRKILAATALEPPQEAPAEEPESPPPERGGRELERLRKEKLEGERAAALQAKVDRVSKQVEQMNSRGRETTAERRERVEDVLTALDIDPIRELVQMYRLTDENGDHVLTPDQRIKIMLELQQYRAPKLRAAEFKHNVDERISLEFKVFKMDQAAGRVVEDAVIPMKLTEETGGE